MRRWPALLLVFGSSAAVLVTEIAAGRAMAPYVGVSLETFTGVIGVVLAGIATGAAVGGALADRHDPRRLLGPALGLGGGLVWVSVPIVEVLGPELGEGPVAIVTLTALAFFAPSAALSAVTPIVAKLRLDDLDQTGTVFGGLSAAGTVGGLVGTFLTGFVLVSLVGTRAILFSVGVVAVVAGVGVEWWLRRRPPLAAITVVALAAALVTTAFEPTCDRETRYSCARIEVDPDDSSRRSLYLDRSHHGRVDLDDPTYLAFRYVRLFADVAEALPPGPLDVLHLGGGAFSFPAYLAAVRPGSTGHVLEIDGGVVDLARDELGLVTGPELTVDATDARLALDDLDTDAYDLIVGDAFSGQTVPWHLTTVEVVEELDRLLRPEGVYVINVIDGGPNGFARSELATLRAVFDHVGAIWPEPGPPARPRNQVLVASSAPLPALDVDPADGMVVDPEVLDDHVGDARILTDDFAPVDQLLTN